MGFCSVSRVIKCIIKFSKRKLDQNEWKVFNFVGINNLYSCFSFSKLFQKLGIGQLAIKFSFEVLQILGSIFRVSGLNI